MPAGYVPSFSWPKLGIYGIYGTQRIMGKEWDITTRIHVHIYIHTYTVYMVLWCVMVIPFHSQCDHNGYANGISWSVRWDRDRQEKLDFRGLSCRFRPGFYASFLLTWGVSRNGDTPIAGWFISWNIPLEWMMTRGTPISGNAYILYRFVWK